MHQSQDSKQKNLSDSINEPCALDLRVDARPNLMNVAPESGSFNIRPTEACTVRHDRLRWDIGGNIGARC